ncbi:solute carrier organic anion transporter family member 1C1 isoform X3 [Brachyhypopomus gauderio]|uniref:solute carrier organic anion transporter family member 1C1 isoform X3 n=1 Tax=Brachyhypopomus gauderio TaxID=698409 RepID=UPI0040422577
MRRSFAFTALVYMRFVCHFENVSTEFRRFVFFAFNPYGIISMKMTVPTTEDMTSTNGPDRKTTKEPCCTAFKMFIVSLSFAYFSKALAGTYMKSAITQIERRFDLPSSTVGLIDVSFEMGNLLFLVLVSHFGAKMHRPRLIGCGCFVMAVGSAVTGLPHFFMGRYTYETVIPSSLNASVSIVACRDVMQSDFPDLPSESSQKTYTGLDCVGDPGSSMWVYVFLGNALRGIGETPVTPLGISYIDDFAKRESSAFYIACLQTIALLGPMFGFLLGSMCAKLYVDIGFVNVDSLAITPKDARWVGAWWLGFFVSATVMLLAGIPFWFLPSSLPKQEVHDPGYGHGGQQQVTNPATPSVKLADIAKGFLPSLKRLLGTPTYFLLLCGSVLKFNSLTGLFTFKAKYMEQQFGQSASRANFLLGVLNLPVISVGIFLGGLLMKRYRLSVVSGAKLSFLTSFLAYLLLLLQFGTKCDNPRLAGLTVSYNGTPQISYDEQTLFSPCNLGCVCSPAQWEPVCSDNGITYMSPCLAGCTNSVGHGKNTIFHNCSCVLTPSPVGGSTSVSLGQCPRGPECSRSFTTYMAVSVLSSFINSLGVTPAYMVIIRCINPDLKALALGIHTLVIRTLGGIPAPVYFGALIDTTCLKWGVKSCGGRGACRMYDSDLYRVIFLGLVTCLSGCSYFFAVAVIVLLKKQSCKESIGSLQKTSRVEIELQPPGEHIDESDVDPAPSSHAGVGLGPREGAADTAPPLTPTDRSSAGQETPGDSMSQQGHAQVERGQELRVDLHRTAAPETLGPQG